MRFLFPCRRAARRVANRHLHRRIESRTCAATSQRSGTAIRPRVGTVGGETRANARGITQHPDAAGTTQTAVASICEPGSGDALDILVASAFRPTLWCKRTCPPEGGRYIATD